METTEGSSRSSESEEKRYAPTVTKDKWHSHALNKLARGYVLILGTERRTANFYMPGKGYEMCAYDIARMLVREGMIVKAYEHDLGDAYVLAAPPERRPAPVKPKPDVDEMAHLIDELAQDDLEDDLDDDAELEDDLALEDDAEFDDDADPDNL